jgi:hypothetical protein
VEPVAGARTVHRTVRVAVALLLGQALLCAVIGWLTYRYSPAHRQRGPAVVDQMAGAPRVLPKSPAPPTPVVRPAETSARGGSPPPTRPPPTHAPAPRSTAPPSFSVPPFSAGPVTSSAPPPAAPAPPAPSTSPAEPSNSPVPTVDLLPPLPVQHPVTVGELCRPLGAIGRTEDGTEVRCLRSRNHRPRWKIV